MLPNIDPRKGLKIVGVYGADDYVHFTTFGDSCKLLTGLLQTRPGVAWQTDG